jgi:outer membrane receptor for ferrienterochelin and colicin
MHGLRRWLAAALVVSVSGVLQVPIALADERTDARREFRAGMQAVAEGRYDEGIAHLESAYDTLPHPNVLYNIGLAHMYAGRGDEAISYFERYKETAPPSDAAEIDALITSLKGKGDAVAQEETPSGEATGQGDVASAIETAAREVRRMAEETQNEALKRQADDLDATAKALRAGQPVPEQQGTAQTQTPAPDAPKPAQLTAESKQSKQEGMYEEEVVSASRFAQSPLDAPNATAIITAQDIRMTGLTTITDLLRRVVGMEVTTVTPVHAEVSIRGFNRRQSNKVLFLVDGRSHRLDFLGTSWFNQMPIPVEDIERIEVIKGPASALYGADAFSGIVNVITRKPGEGRSYLQGNFGSDNFARGVGSFTGKSGKLAYRFSASYSQTDNVVIPAGANRIDVAPLTDRPNSARKGATVASELVYEAAKDTSIVLGGNAVYGDNTVQGLSRLGQVTSFNAMDAHAYATLNLPVGFKVSSWWDRIDANSGPSVITPGAIDVVGRGLKQDIADVDVAWSGRFKLLVPQNLTLGGGYRFKRIQWEWIDGVRRQHHFGAYLQDVIELHKRLTLQLGARVDRHPLLPKVQFSPRGSLVYRFVERQSLRLSIGRAFRGPSFLESYTELQNGAPQRGATGLGLGNANLNPESIVSYELGYQNQASDYFSFEANVYFNTAKDLLLFNDIRQFTLQEYGDPNNDQAKYDPTVEAFPFSLITYRNSREPYRQIGGELGIRVYPVPGLDIYANYSIHDTAPMKKVDAVRAKEQQTSMHKVNAGVQYRARFGLDLSADVSYTSPQVWLEQVTDPGRGVKFQAFRVDDFVMVTARIGYRLWNDQLELGVVGTNLAFQDKRQHPYSQPLDTRVFGSVKLRF